MSTLKDLLLSAGSDPNPNPNPGLQQVFLLEAAGAPPGTKPLPEARINIDLRQVTNGFWEGVLLP